MPLFNTMIYSRAMSLDGCNADCHGGSLKGRSVTKQWQMDPNKPWQS